jgi:hypothetical protein
MLVHCWLRLAKLLVSKFFRIREPRQLPPVAIEVV